MPGGGSGAWSPWLLADCSPLTKLTRRSGVEPRIVPAPLAESGRAAKRAPPARRVSHFGIAYPLPPERSVQHGAGLLLERLDACRGAPRGRHRRPQNAGHGHRAPVRARPQRRGQRHAGLGQRPAGAAGADRLARRPRRPGRRAGASVFVVKHISGQRCFGEAIFLPFSAAGEIRSGAARRCVHAAACSARAGGSCCQRRSSRSRVSSRPASLRMTATRATLGGLPRARSRW